MVGDTLKKERKKIFRKETAVEKQIHKRLKALLRREDTLQTEDALRGGSILVI